MKNEIYSINIVLVVIAGSLLIGCGQGSASFSNLPLLDNAAGANCGSSGCSSPQLSAWFSTNSVPVGSSASLNILSQNVTGIAWNCTVANGGAQLGQGQGQSGSQSVNMAVSSDTKCVVTAVGNDGTQLQATATVAVDCGSQIKIGGSCQDFQCTNVIALQIPQTGNLEIPARGPDETCYSLQIASAIPEGPSYLTATHDLQVESRNHDINAGDPSLVWNPYQMSSTQLNFSLDGLRTVKLSGGLNITAPILVDNFVLVGIYPVGTPTPYTNTYYQAYGTADSTITIAGISSILFQNNPILLTPFAPGGTSTIAPLDLTTQLQSQVPYSIDVRAEDCGGARNMSDLFLLFQ